MYQYTDERGHDRSNQGQSALIILGMVAILGVAGFSLSGASGLAMALMVSLVMVFMAGRASPKLVLKMYKAKPIGGHDLPQLQAMFDVLVERAELDHSPQLYYVPSKMLNAFAAGRGKQAVVAVTHGLLDKMNNREIAGVLAHELAHIKHRDVWVMSLADIFSRLTTSMGQFGQIMILISIVTSVLGMGALLPWAAVIALSVAPMANSLLQLALSRSREYEADYGAAQITGDPAGLASALRKIERLQKGWIQKVLMPGRKVPEPALLRTHPPTEDRIKRLLAMEGARELPQQPTMPADIVNPPPGYVVLRRPRWHLTSGLWY